MTGNQNHRRDRYHKNKHKLLPKQVNNVNHPNHYNQGKIEVIDAIEDWDLGFNDGNVIKYVSRYKHKGRPLEDLKKAKWYLEREIKRIEKKSK